MHSFSIFVPKTLEKSYSFSLNHVRFGIVRQGHSIHFSESDFDNLTNYDIRYEAEKTFGWKAFERMMRNQMLHYLQTMLTDFTPYRTPEEVEFTSISTLKMIFTELLR